MKILGLCGSLRAASINAALLRAVALLVPADIELSFFSLGELPLFNPDLEQRTPQAVTALYRQIAAADALLIASPEYAHGISGVLKNALDWLVGFEPFVDKRVAIVNCSARAHHADTALREVLKTMSARIIEDASITIPLLGANLSEQGIADDPMRSAMIKEMLQALRRSLSGADNERSKRPLFPVIAPSNNSTD